MEGRAGPESTGPDRTVLDLASAQASSRRLALCGDLLASCPAPPPLPDGVLGTLPEAVELVGGITLLSRVAGRHDEALATGVQALADATALATGSLVGLDHDVAGRLRPAGSAW